MSLDDVYVVNPKLALVTQDELALAEQTLNTSFPKLYDEFVTRFGSGEFCGLIRVHVPQQVVEKCAEFRARVTEYFNWNESGDSLSKQQVAESIRIGDTLEGDELIFHPSDPTAIYLLPRNEDEITRIGSDFIEALANVLRYKGEDHPQWYFDSAIGRQLAELARIKKRPNILKVKDAILALEPIGLVEEVISGCELSIEVFLPQVSGSVLCEGSKTSFSTYLAFSCDHDSEALKAVLATLERQGFVTPYLANGRPHPEILKLVDSIFPMKGLVPSPIAARDRTPKDVVHGFIAAVNRWELGMAAWFDAGFPPGPQSRIAESIIAEFCVPGCGRKFACFCASPLFDPDRETIIRLDQESDKKAIVQTKREGGDWPFERDYFLTEVDGEWRIESVWTTDFTSWGLRQDRKQWL